MIVENPCGQPHYLTLYFPVQSKLIDKDRTQRGDWYKKPTQYWFVNFNPRTNFVLEPVVYRERKIIEETKSVTERSMISKDYARRFILERIIDESIPGVVLTNGE